MSSDHALAVVDRDVARDVTTESPAIASRDPSESDIFKAILSNRDLGPGQEIKARSLFNVGLALMNQVLRRDVTPEEFLARDGVRGLVESVVSRNPISEQQMQARFADIIKKTATPSPSRRDVASEELTSRDNGDDLALILNSRELGFKRDMQLQRRASLFTGVLSWFIHKLMSLPLRIRDLTPDDLASRDFIDGLFSEHISKPSAREPSLQQETGALSDEGDAAGAFNALLNSRDLSSRLTIEDVVNILASRALDGFD